MFAIRTSIILHAHVSVCDAADQSTAAPKVLSHLAHCIAGAIHWVARLQGATWTCCIEVWRGVLADQTEHKRCGDEQDEGTPGRRGGVAGAELGGGPVVHPERHRLDSQRPPRGGELRAGGLQLLRAESQLAAAQAHPRARRQGLQGGTTRTGLGLGDGGALMHQTHHRHGASASSHCGHPPLPAHEPP